MCLSIAITRPNDVLSRGEHRGFEWVVTHNGMGYRCGYVKIPRGHPWYGKGDDEIDAAVHGGITFAEPDVDCGGGPDDGWWVGFDCAHAWDRPDPTLPTRKPAIPICPPDAEVRGQEYAEAECRSLCDQAARAI